MKRYSVYFLTLILFSISICFADAAEKITLSFSATEAVRLPEGGTPSDPDHYNTFEVSVSVSGLESNQYYDIEGQVGRCHGVSGVCGEL